MFKKLFVVAFFLYSFCVNAQKKYHKSFFTNGQLKEEGWVTKNQKNGYWKFYYKNGNIKKEGRFKDNLETKY
jgi:antitoxin component YwqK of YwqJK toxin-antitoxin module